jgi:hypothetical protein
MLSLLEKRQIHAFIIEDLGQIVKAANDKAKTWKLENGSAWPAQDDAKPVNMEAAGFVVRKFITEYRGPGGTSDPSAPPADPAAAGGASLGVINITMAVATSRASEADANKFMINTVDAWLKANRERIGVPYRIVASPGGTYWRRLSVIPLEPEVPAKKPEGDGGERQPDGGGAKGRGDGNPRQPGYIPGGEGDPTGGGATGLGLAPLDKLSPQVRMPGAVFVMQVDWTVELINPNEKKQEPGT